MTIPISGPCGPHGPPSITMYTILLMHGYASAGDGPASPPPQGRGRGSEAHGNSRFKLLVRLHFFEMGGWHTVACVGSATVSPPHRHAWPPCTCFHILLLKHGACNYMHPARHYVGSVVVCRVQGGVAAPKFVSCAWVVFFLGFVLPLPITP